MLCAVGTLALAPGAAAQTTPSLRLLPPAKTPVSLPTYGGGVALDLGVYVAPVGADLELRVARADYDSLPVASLVDAQTHAVLASLPWANLNGWQGLRRFFQVTVAKPDGTPVATVFRPFCPNGFDRTRIDDDSGPATPRYPGVCRSFSPFTKGMVWGIEEGWATAAFPRDEYGTARRQLVRLAPGRYHVTVEITPFFQAFFGIAAGDATVTVDAIVRRSGFGRRPAEQALTAATASGGVPEDLDPDPATLPDLVALPAWSARLRAQGGRDYLAFATTGWNAGPAPLVIEGFRRPGTRTMDAFQYFHDSHGDVVGRAPVGTFRFDTRRGHRHWHVLQFARYSIVDAATDEVLRSLKQSFCLAPTDPIDLTVPGAALSPWSRGLASVCGDKGARWIREALAAGWGDTYYQYVAGQAFDVTTLPNGRYRMRVTMNPLGLLHEATTANNVEDRYFTLRGRPGRRTLDVEPWHGIRR